ncbi:MAG: VOC family protein [Flavobacteriales bacterium]|nr:VOC family protein [Flavobacteriales bacterium]
MSQNLMHIALVVKDYNEAIQYYTEVLKFELLEDTRLSDTKRWVLVRPKGSNSCALLLAKAANDEQKNFIGNQSGGRVFLFLHTDSFDEDHQNLIKYQVSIIRPPVQETWGRVLVFEDIYGNKWDLIEAKK